jgi:hypothetical protein
MGVKMLTEGAGALQGVGPDTIARQVYGLLATYKPDTTGDMWPGYAGAIVRPTTAVIQGNTIGQWDVLDLVVEVHEV